MISSLSHELSETFDLHISLNKYSSFYQPKSRGTISHIQSRVAAFDVSPMPLLPVSLA
jgi:hypothetical protein